MKIFIKLYIGIMAILVSALLISGYLMVSRSLKKSIDYEVESCVEHFNMFLTSFQNNLIVATRSKLASPELVSDITKMTKGNSNMQIAVEMDGVEVVSDLPRGVNRGIPEDNSIKYDIVKSFDHVYVVCYSRFIKRNISYTCTSASEITDLINDNNSQRHGYYLIYVFVLIGGTLFALFFSMNLTKPIRHLSEAGKAISEGEYGKEIEVISNDELGDLTRIFNNMSETIREKMDDMELSVRQKEEFIAAFAHETKSPMQSIIGYADLIYQKKLNDEEKREAAEVIMNEGMRLQALSEKLMDIVSLSESGITKEQIDTSEMLEDIKATVAPRAQAKGARVLYSLAEHYINVDYDLFKTVIMNLIDNSLKAGAEKISIYGDKREDGSYVIYVKDDGIGIPPEELSRVKEAFYMVDKSRSRKEHGAGLGLSLADRIMKLHGGSMDIKSEEGQGTEIRLTIPSA